MLALTRMARAAANVTSMRTVLSGNGFVIFQWTNWGVLIREHHAGFIDWATFEANQKRLDSNTRPGPHRKGPPPTDQIIVIRGTQKTVETVGRHPGEGVK